MHTNCLELLAATLAIQTFAKKQDRLLINLKMDVDGQHAHANLHQQDGRSGITGPQPI